MHQPRRRVGVQQATGSVGAGKDRVSPRLRGPAGVAGGGGAVVPRELVVVQFDVEVARGDVRPVDQDSLERVGRIAGRSTGEGDAVPSGCERGVAPYGVGAVRHLAGPAGVGVGGDVGPERGDHLLQPGESAGLGERGEGRVARVERQVALVVDVDARIEPAHEIGGEAEGDEAAGVVVARRQGVGGESRQPPDRVPRFRRDDRESLRARDRAGGGGDGVGPRGGGGRVEAGGGHRAPRRTTPAAAGPPGAPPNWS